jgi:Ca2+-binding EF-hand superfamily protein
MKRAFRILADPKTNKMSKDRWIQLWKKLSRKDKNDKVLLTFKLIDEDEDGQIGNSHQNNRSAVSFV